MDKEKTYTKAELENIEKLASEYNFVDMGAKLGLSANHFLNLRKNHKQVKEAVDRGVLARGKEYKNKYRKKHSERMKKSHKIKGLKIKVPMEIKPKDALQRFREEFEARKRKRDLAELKELDLT